MGHDADPTYGDRIAHRYDEIHRHLEAETPGTVDFLASLARGRALELGTGTGRVALPLADMGVEVHGIESSQARVERMSAKARGRTIPVTIGNFADVGGDGPFSLIFVVFNTFFALTDPEEQIRCLRNVERALTEDGVFVVEAFVPDPTRFDRGQRMSVIGLEEDAVLFDASTHDAVHQRVDTRHVWISEDGVELFPVSLRYVWPSELDLMARLAGMNLRERWGGWRREPFVDSSARHVCVYERAAAAYL
ncbi:MAG: class I SAM-dependent methyltransferase [Actinomycetota bacterium]